MNWTNGCLNEVIIEKDFLLSAIWHEDITYLFLKVIMNLNVTNIINELFVSLFLFEQFEFL